MHQLTSLLQLSCSLLFSVNIQHSTNNTKLTSISLLTTWTPNLGDSGYWLKHHRRDESFKHCYLGRGELQSKIIVINPIKSHKNKYFLQCCFYIKTVSRKGNKSLNMLAFIFINHLWINPVGATFYVTTIFLFFINK